VRILTNYRTQIIVALIALLGSSIAIYFKYFHQRESPTPYQGRVIDIVSMAGINGASVSAVNTGIPSDGYTDQNGVFHLDLPGKPRSVLLRVLAGGYQPFQQFVSLTEDKFEDVRLSPNVPSPPATPSPQPSPSTGKPNKRPTRRTEGGDSNLLERKKEAVDILSNANHL
jgi:hypothetical protein